MQFVKVNATTCYPRSEWQGAFLNVLISPQELKVAKAVHGAQDFLNPMFWNIASPQHVLLSVSLGNDMIDVPSRSIPVDLERRCRARRRCWSFRRVRIAWPLSSIQSALGQSEAFRQSVPLCCPALRNGAHPTTRRGGSAQFGPSAPRSETQAPVPQCAGVRTGLKIDAVRRCGCVSRQIRSRPLTRQRRPRP